MLVADGLNASDISEYANAMEKYHYRRKFAFGDLKVAHVPAGNGLAAYEVIYADVVDQLADINEELLLNDVTSTAVQNHNLVPYLNSSGQVVGYPASILNMRQQILNEIGQATHTVLPRWMTATQPNNEVIGWVPAVPLIYCAPGQAAEIIAELDRNGFDIKQIDFEVDRYIWDNNMTTQTQSQYYYNTTFSEDINQYDAFIKFPESSILGK